MHSPTKNDKAPSGPQKKESKKLIGHQMIQHFLIPQIYEISQYSGLMPFPKPSLVFSKTIAEMQSFMRKGGETENPL